MLLNEVVILRIVETAFSTPFLYIYFRPFIMSPYILHSAKYEQCLKHLKKRITSPCMDSTGRLGNTVLTADL